MEDIRMIGNYNQSEPNIHHSAFIAKDAVVVGDVTIGEDSSVWFKTVIRGDVAPTIIGNKVNIQDLCMLHQSPNLPLTIEDRVTVGHQVTLHSATIRKNALIGMGSIILDGAEVGENAFLGAGSLIPPGKIVPPNTLVMGRPAKVVRELTEDDVKEMKRIVQDYADKALFYKKAGY
jgi:carbonic anhydrase/acetyltransferase-like protein (isoleucine patch superfamily)